MNERISNYLNYILSEEHHKFRKKEKNGPPSNLKKSLSFVLRNLGDLSEKGLILYLNRETPVILPNERIVFTRTISKNFYFGGLHNNVVDYGTTIKVGLEGRRTLAMKSIEKCKEQKNRKGQRFLKKIINVIDAIEKLSDKYAQEAKKKGNEEVYQILTNIPRNGATTFHEALQFLRILQFVRRYDNIHLAPIGRFDQYMYPYLQDDLDSGRLDYDSAYELLEEYFISCNKDSDMYGGAQQGDNGQSLVLGGVDKDGNDVYNILSEMCLKASADLKIIDPKINLRVNKDTPLEIYELGTELTKKGLGFPQYSNDDIVIPGLVELGYELEDARNYALAACWEFIIPGYGLETVNADVLSYVSVVNRAVKHELVKSKDFESFFQTLPKYFSKQFSKIVKRQKLRKNLPAVYHSLLSIDSIERAVDISKCGKYNNLGIHGPGLANAADSLAAIKKHVFEEKTITPEELVKAIDANFDGYEEIRSKLHLESPKMGNNDDYVDQIGVRLLEMFANTLKSKKNKFGGCFRPGTGSAQFYYLFVDKLGASADGRRKGEMISANYSPSLNVKLEGPISTIQSFTKFDLKKTINGGPLTLELHDSVFRNEDSIKKVAMLVKSSMDMGLHQFQLNSINREDLLNAQKHPENYKNLIVRVWGWSGYFIELDEGFQNHIISRAEITI